MSDWQTPRTLGVGAQVSPGGPCSSEERRGALRSSGSPVLGERRPMADIRLPKVAAVGPTPQLEIGELSPMPGGTPRIPLAELDQSTLSQRLFTPPVSMSILRPNSSNLSQVSPNQMLMSQSLVPSVSPSFISRERLERRHQLNTERQLMELHQQVEQLSRQQQGGSRAVYQQVEKLSLEREELLEQVFQRDQQLDQFKSALANLNQEYVQDVQQVKEEASLLAQQVEEVTNNYNNLMEEYAALEKQHNKSLKTIVGLKNYITGLPTKEELSELKTRLSEREGENEELEASSTELRRQLEEARGRLRGLEQKAARLEVENEHLAKSSAELGNKVQEVENIRLEARGKGEEDLELLIFDNKQLTEERDKLRKALELRTKQFQEESKKLEEQVKEVGRLLEGANLELQEKGTDLGLAHGSVGVLEAQLKKKSEECAVLSGRLAQCDALSSNLQSEASQGSKLDGHYLRLVRSVARCITELSGLHELCNQVLGGENPNVSVLLGVRDMELCDELEVLQRDSSQLSVEEKLELVRNQLNSVQRVQEQIKDLRSRITDRYAENLADNMTSCVTQ